MNFSTRLGRAIAVLLVVLPCGPCLAQINVFVDWTDFELRLDEATTAAGVASFSGSEVTTIKTNIVNDITSHYSGFSINFTETNPGGDYETLVFGLTGSGYGRADSIDFRNQLKTGTGRIYTANFDDFIESSDPRNVQIAELSTSLAGTAGHELGHNLGLQHLDPFGIASFTGTADKNGGYITGDAQNVHVMATGGTGLNEAQRETFRTFSDLSGVKLHMAEGVSPNPITLTNEQSGSHSSAGTAQHLDLQSVAFASEYDDAGVVKGFFGGASDYYSVDLEAGDKILLEILSEIIYSDDFDSFLRFYDTDGTTLLFENDDVEMNTTGVNNGGFYSLESMLWNVPVETAGRYFIEVDAFNSIDSGDYDLVIAVERFQAIPEPTAVLFLSSLAIGLGLRRRR